VLEVFDPLSSTYDFSFMTPFSADREHQVLEHVTPVAAEVGDPPPPRVRKVAPSDAGTLREKEEEPDSGFFRVNFITTSYRFTASYLLLLCS
jgi:hypothetical protein